MYVLASGCFCYHPHIFIALNALSHQKHSNDDKSPYVVILILTVLAEGPIQSCVRALSSPAYEINGQGSHALGSYLHEDGSPEHFLDHTQVAQVCQDELQVAVINNKQWCAPVFGMCSTSCSGGCFSHLCSVGEWQCPVLRVEQPRPVLRADRVRRSETVGGGSSLHLCFAGEWQSAKLRL